MPKVGDKHYSYSKAGKAAAKKYAKRTGKTMTLGAKGSKRKSPIKAKLKRRVVRGKY